MPMEEKQEKREKLDKVENVEKVEKTGKVEKQGALYDLYSLMHDLVYILAGITLVFVFCVRLVGVNGNSMVPTLQNADYLALQSNVIMGDLEYGDIIVARKLSFREGEPIVKRVIATEGQQVSILRDTDGVIRVYVDGVALQEDYINGEMIELYRLPIEVTVEKDHIFVMGDNRNDSADSRSSELGQIHVDEVLGKVLFIVFPGKDSVSGQRNFSRIGKVS